jgi:F-type H+-transporting ATPase subunit gamma
MTDTLVSLRHKLNGAEQLASVVRAMKAAAASAIGQYEAAVQALGDYEHSIELGLSVCLRAPNSIDIPDSKGSEDRPIGALVFGSDQGLVGSFNEVIAAAALGALRGLPGHRRVWAVGERLCSYLEEAGQPVFRRFTVPGSIAAVTPLVAQIQMEVEEYSADHGRGEIHVFHNRPESTSRYQPAAQRVLPFDASWRRRLGAIRWPTTVLPEALGDLAVTLRALIREYLFICLYKACAESLASENASRLEAMQRAQQNIEELSAGLRLSLNRLRQSSIDAELFDIVAGFNTLAERPR